MVFTRTIMLLNTLLIPFILHANPAMNQVPVATASVGALLSQAQNFYNERASLEKARQALSLWEEALKTEPSNYEALWKAARANYWMGNHAKNEEGRMEFFTKGKELAEAAANSNPDGVDGHYWLGVCLGRYGETKGILKSLSLATPIKAEMETILKLDSNHAGAHHVLGVLYRKLPKGLIGSIAPGPKGDKKKALRYAKKAVELDPMSLKYLIGLAEVETALGNKEKAKEHLREVLRMPPHPEYVPESLEEKETAQKLLEELK